MNRRTVEFFLVLVVAAVLAAALLREKAEETYELVESPLPSPVNSLPTASSSVPNVSPSPIRATVLYTPVVREDYELAVYRTARYGVDGTGMVPWDGILSDEELWCITHYVMFLQEES